MRGTRKTVRNLEVPLDRDELVELGHQAGEARRTIIMLEAEKKSQVDRIKGLIEAQESIVSERLDILRTGARVEEVQVEIRYHEPSKGKRTVVRLDSGVCVAIEDMTAQEIAEDEQEPSLPYDSEAIARLRGLLEAGASIDEIESWAASVYAEQGEREIVSLYIQGLKQKEVKKILEKAGDPNGLFKLAMAMPTAAAEAATPAERLASAYRLGKPSDDEVGVILNAWGVTDEDTLKTVVAYFQSLAAEAGVDDVLQKLKERPEIEQIVEAAIRWKAEWVEEDDEPESEDPQAA